MALRFYALAKEALLVLVCKRHLAELGGYADRARAPCGGIATSTKSPNVLTMVTRKDYSMAVDWPESSLRRTNQPKNPPIKPVTLPIMVATRILKGDPVRYS
jgi:hypothetical protein